MADLNDIYKTDLVDDVLASGDAGYNKLLSSVLYAAYRNVETISATKELADDDYQIQLLTPSGSNQTVELPPEATTNHQHLIACASGASFSVVVKDDGGATTYATLAAGESALFVSSGTSWEIIKPPNATQAEMEAGTETETRQTSPLLIAQAISALGGGGTGLTDVEIAPTTANVTLTANYRHYVDASGLTADRSLVFPSASSGDTLEIVIVDEHADYACVLEGDTGVDVEGLTATEWDRLYHAGMALSFSYRTSDGWRLVSDNRNGLWRRITLTGSQSTISFANIPDIYNTIEFDINARSDKATVTGQAVRYTVNKLTTSIYSYTLFYWVSDGTTGELEGLQQANAIFASVPAAGAPANQFAGGFLTFHNYAGSKHKFAQYRGGRVGSYTSTGDVRLYDNMSTVETTNAINRVDIFDDTDNFIAGTEITLYVRK